MTPQFSLAISTSHYLILKGKKDKKMGWYNINKKKAQPKSDDLSF